MPSRRRGRCRGRRAASPAPARCPCSGPSPRAPDGRAPPPARRPPRHLPPKRDAGSADRPHQDLQPGL
ncbi:MAG: hypothetical protein GEV04_24480 [Actinophytocola sp.]|nr:hypothetical protein [Actinophytocola sp.]